MRRYGEWMEGEGRVSRMDPFRGTFGAGGSDGLMGVGLGKGGREGRGEGGELGGTEMGVGKDARDYRPRLSRLEHFLWELMAIFLGAWNSRGFCVMMISVRISTVICRTVVAGIW